MGQDSELQQAVLAELSWEPSVTAAHVGVTASAGVVTLTGHVESYPEKHAALQAAARVRGVQAVAEEMEVRLPPGLRRDDEAIAAAALERLAWDGSVPRDAIRVVVEGGCITLSGQTDWQFQKEAAGQDVLRLRGVVGLSNRIVVRAKVDAASLGSDILHALHRSWCFDEASVRVSAEGGHVRLSGTAHSPADRQTAEATAWAAPGTTSVVNDIAIILA